MNSHSLAHVSYLARRASKGRRDTTKYGNNRASARSFFVHHTQRLALAAVLGDARAIRKEIRGHKQRLAAGRPASGAP